MAPDEVESTADTAPTDAQPDAAEIGEVSSEPVDFEPTSTSASASASAGPRRSPGWLAFAVVLAVAVAAAGFGGWQWRHAHDLGDDDALRTQVGRVAGEFGEALLTYDYANLPAARQRVLDHATDRFGQEYTSAFTAGLETAITKLQAASTATVRYVYLSDVQRDTAKAIVVLDSQVTSTAGTKRTVSSYLDMALVRQNGQWKVDTVVSVAAADQTTTPPDGATTTTVPGATTTTAPLIPVVPG